ncbi:MAG: hypothetical protein H0U77_12490 [Nocardioidaceae bacterium]|nr:hypothetical protein [Nocardioidaceae bacterium]
MSDEDKDAPRGPAVVLDAIRGTARTATWRRRGVSAHAIGRGEWSHPAHGIARPRDNDCADRVDDWMSVAVAAMGPRHALGGWASGRLQGVVHMDGVRFGELAPVLVHCLDGAQLRKRRQIRPSEARVDDDELSTVERTGVTTLARAAFDEACDARGLEDAVVALDSFAATLRGGARTTLAAVALVVSRHGKHRGIVQAREALTLASVRAMSPWETRLRLRAERVVDADELMVNVPVFTTDGRLLGVPDLLDVSSGLVLESDGSHHRDMSEHSADNRREEGMEDADLEVVRFGAVDHRDPSDMERRIANGRRRALARPGATRGWTLQPPAWWYGSRLAQLWV